MHKIMFVYVMAIPGILYSQNPIPAKAPAATQRTAASTLTAAPAAAKNSPIPFPMTLNVYIDNKLDAPSNNINTVNTSQIDQAHDSSILKKLAELKAELPSAQTIKATLANYQSSLWSNYKWHIMGGSLITSYGLLCYLIFSGNAYLGQFDLWSSWRQEMPLDQLLSIPQMQFAQELLSEIQRRYTDPGSLTDLVRPLTLFMQALEKEEETIKWYQSAYSWITYLRLNSLIPFSKVKFAQITARLQRVAYYKNVFQTWAAQYQLDHAKRSIMISRPDPFVKTIAKKMKLYLHTIVQTFIDFSKNDAPDYRQNPY